MNYDIFLEHGLQTRETLLTIGNDSNLNIYLKLKLMSMFLGTTLQEIAKAQYRTIVQPKDNISSLFSEKIIGSALNTMQQIGILQPDTELLTGLPYGSFFIQFQFILAKPFLSTDDETYYISDNPIRKDKVFKIPIASGNSWKGNMRWTAMKNYLDALPIPDKIPDIVALDHCLKQRSELVRLFGHEKDMIEKYLNHVLAERYCGEATPDCKEEISSRFEESLRKCGYPNKGVDGRRGRLNFYSTFFDRISLEVINPHDRTRKVGKLPIYIESVPKGAMGLFSLLYVPFDLMGRSDEIIQEEITDDLACTVRALREMMLTYGFSAKKSSGFGIVANNFKFGALAGRMTINGIRLSNYQFNNFHDLSNIVEEVRRKV